MLEFLYSDSAAGSLRCAMNRRCPAGGCLGVIGTHEDGTPLTPAETDQLRQEQETAERRRWDEAVPLEGDFRDILSFPLALDLGPLDDGGLGPERKAFLEELFSVFPEGQQAAADMLDAARTNLDTLLARATDTPVRFWLDRSPGSVCGLRWVLARLRPLGFENLDLRVVFLPALRPYDGGGLVLQQLGEVHPAEWGRLAQQTRPLPADQAAALAGQWQILQRQSAPLRAVLNGVLVSAGEDLYDPYLKQVLGTMDDTFAEATLIGRTLAQFPLGFGDAWLDLRVERWIAAGRLAVAVPPPDDQPRYHRTLRKCVF